MSSIAVWTEKRSQTIQVGTCNVNLKKHLPHFEDLNSLDKW